MAKLYNLARMTTATTGTGTITLGSAVPSYLSFASSGVSNGETVTYAIVDGNNREVGRGVYTASGTTLTRTVLESTNSNNPINLSGNAEVFITAAAEDIANVGETNTFTASQVISATDNSNAALRVTQLGTGNAILVEDSTNPDSTPFIVTNDGQVVSGSTTSVSGTAGIARFQSNNSLSGFSAHYAGVDASPAINTFLKSRGGAVVNSEDQIGSFRFEGFDGTNYVRAAQISTFVDGTPGTNDMPGRLVFSTTADGASSPTERLRISNDGTTTITGTGVVASNSSGTAFRVTQTGSGNAFVVEDQSNPDSSPFVVTAEGRVGIGEDVPTFYLQVAAPNALTQTAMGVTSTNYLSDFKATYLQYSDASTTGTTYGITNANLGSLLFQNTSNALIGTNGGTPLIFGTTSLERFRIGSSGQWGIGGANYGTSGQAIVSNGSASAPSWTSVALTGSANTFSANQIISVTDNSNAALRVTQLGTGNAILVEDSTNPDATPFVVTADGNVGVGLTNPSTQLQVVGTSQNRLWLGSAATTNRQLFVRSNGTFASPTIVASGDAVGSANFFGYDGAANIELANITASVDGTPGTNDMPGRITFSTTADGASSVTERFRIGSAGQLGIAGANYGTSGQILTSGGASAAPSWVDPSSMTLLGTITTTSGTSQTLTSLTLTGYRYLFLSVNDVSATTTTDDLRIVDGAGNSFQLFADSGVAENVWNGTVLVNLFNGSIAAWGQGNTSTTYSTGTGNFGAGTAGTKLGFGRVNVTTASTSIGVSVQTAFDAGTVTVYGVR